jgi:hypothetical protein
MVVVAHGGFSRSSVTDCKVRVGGVTDGGPTDK